MFTDVTAAKNGERPYVRRAMLNARHVYLIVRLIEEPLILFENIEAKPLPTFEARQTVIVPPAKKERKLQVDLGASETRCFRMTCSEEHFKMLVAAQKLRDTTPKVELANDGAQNPRKIVQCDILLSYEEQADIVSTLTGLLAASGSADKSTLSFYPLENITTSDMRAVQMTVRQRYGDGAPKSLFERMLNAVKICAQLYNEYSVMSYPMGTDVRVLVNHVDNKTLVKDWARATIPGFLPSDKALQFAEDLPSAWSTRDAPTAAAASTVSASFLGEEAKTMQGSVGANEEIFVVKVDRPVKKDVFDKVLPLLHLAPLAVKQGGRCVLAKGPKSVEEEKVALPNAINIWVSRLSTVVEAEGGTSASQ